MIVPFAVDKQVYCDCGSIYYVKFNAKKHSLIVGATGSGKSTCARLLLAKYSKYLKIRLTIIDYKQEFDDLKDNMHCYFYEDSIKGIKDYYNSFQNALKEGTIKSSYLNILYVDELSAILSSRNSKQEAAEIKDMLFTIGMLGRSYGYFLIVGLQYANISDNFRSGARDQFSQIIALGNLSKEQKNMLFSGYKEQIASNFKVGEGVFLQDGKGLTEIIVPIYNVSIANEYIRKALDY